ncbi:MAG TPA: elongation factor P, partial [Planctomycetia bacterium]|nr:elongation factor P [Planctomycetia bacterium]
MASYNTSDLKKGLKVEIDSVPYQILECQFVKPGKGQALYKLRLQNLLRGTTIERTLKS